MTFDELRSKHASLTFTGFEYKYNKGLLNISFSFTLEPDITFHSQISLPNIPESRFAQIPKSVIEFLIFNLGMVEMISYWKVACPPKIIIKAGYLSADQIKFWKNLLINGLGEFFYQNQIDFTDPCFVAHSCDYPTKGENNHNVDIDLSDRDLILVGGGKDSAVTLNLINKAKRDYNCMLLNPTGAAKDIVSASGVASIIISRTLDPKLLELNSQGYLNGHTPFSAYLAFLSVIVGVLYDYKNLIVSNESSSNESNIVWCGQEINHQYSKTYEFETLFRQYNKKYLSQTNYFSFLRPLNELQISKLFAQMHQYQQVFRSCNRGSKLGVWCGVCPKCVSTYLLLHPFLGDKVNKIFNKDLFEDEKIVPIIEGLMRKNNVVKPFDCVATTDEIKYAIFLSIKKFKDNAKSLPKVLVAVQDQALDLPVLLKSWNGENNLSENCRKILKDEIK